MKKKTLTTLVLALSTALLASSAAHALCVKVPEAHLRQGPGTHYKKSWTVFAYMPFKMLGRKGNWYRVSDVDGDKHWIHKKLVTDRVHCAVTRHDGTNVRRGPGTRYPLAGLGRLDKYYSFKVVGEKGRWLKVRDDMANTGWIAKSLLWVQ